MQSIVVVIHWYFCVSMYEDVCLYRHTYNLRTIILSIVMLERPMGLANASPQGDRSDSTLFNGLPSMMCCSSCPHSSCSLNSQEFKSPLLVCLHPRWRASDRLQQSLRHWGRGPSSPTHGFCPRLLGFEELDCFGLTCLHYLMLKKWGQPEACPRKLY